MNKEFATSPPRIIIYATCHGIYLGNLLRAAPSLRGYSIDVHLNYGAPGVFKPPSIPDQHLEQCEVFLYHAVRNQPGLDELIRLMDRLRSQTVRIKIPYVTSNLYWLMHYRTWTPLGVSPERQFGIIPYRSQVLDVMVDAGLDDKEVVQLYRNLPIEDVVDVDAAIAETFAYWEDLDKNSDGISIATFLKERYRTEMLFYIFNHPSKAVYCHIANQILDRLGLDRLSDKDLQGQNCGQKQMIPIHPELARRLGLRFINESTRYIVCGQVMNYNDYIRMYCRLRRQENPCS